MAFALALNVARLVTSITVPVRSVIGPADVNDSESALTPASSVALFSLIVTGPPVTCSWPKLVESPTSPPNVMAFALALNVARLVTAITVPVRSVIGPADVSDSESALTPASSVALSSLIVTGPPVTFN